MFLRDDALAEYALRALLDRTDRNSLKLEEVVGTCLEHKNPRIRLQAVVGIQKLGLAQFTEALLALSVEKPRKPLVKGIAHIHNAIPHTARRALIEMGPVEKLHDLLAKPEYRAPSLAVLRQIHTSKNVSRLIRMMDKTENLDVIEALLRLYHREKKWDGESWWGTRPNSAGPYYQGVTWESSNTIARALREKVKGLDNEDQKAVLFQVRRHNLNLDELQLPIEVDPLEQLLDQGTHTFEQQPELLSIVTDFSRPREMRIQAFRAALQVTGFTYANWLIANLTALAEIEKETKLYEMLSRDLVQSTSHRITMMQRVPKAYSKVKRLATAQQSLFFNILCKLVQSPLTTEDERNKIVNGMAKEPLTIEFVNSIRENRARAFGALLKNPGEDPQIIAASQQVLKTFKENEDQYVGELPVEYVTKTILTMEGDANLGRDLFNRQSCSACHSLKPTEPQKGPYLGAVGNLFTREQLISHIIAPAKEVAQGFQTYSFNLKDNSVAIGFVTDRDEKTIKLRNIAGIVQTIELKDVLEEKIIDGSMMPPGLVNGLTLREFASMIDFLQSLH